MGRRGATLVAVAALVACSAPEQAVSAPPSAASSPAATRAVPQASKAPAPGAVVSVSAIDSRLAGRMRYSYRSGCPVPLSRLRYLRLRYWSFDGQRRVGEMVVHRDAVSAVGAAFSALYRQRFRLRQMRLIDDFRGSDDASVAADNTSAFNCRTVAGSASWSQHAYGRAVDVNPFENPYVTRSRVSPPAAAGYARRVPLRRGMLGATAVSAFTSRGWGWGGNWRTVKDYQHFSANGR